MHPDISSWLGGANTPSGTITGAEALAVDTKIDDTFANTGNVLQGFFTSAACGAGGATYPVSNSAPVCTLAINMLATSNIQDQ